MHYLRPSKNNLWIFLIVGILLIGVVYFFFIQEKTALNADDLQLEQCTQHYHDCIQTAQKDGSSFTLNKIGQFHNETQATSFYDRWKNPSNVFEPILLVKPDDFPIVLFAATHKTFSNDIPTVFICSSQGVLLETPTKNLLCPG